MNIFGHNFRLAIWGESHGPQIGISIDGVPAGIPLSAEDFEADLARRRSGARGTTPRREPDIPQIVSGLYNGMTTGAPLTIEFANTDTHSQDYATVARHYRPSHADLVAYHRFNGFNDPRGGGHFSARLTVAFVAAGVVAKKMLPPGIAFDTRLTEIGGCTDPARFDEVLRAAAADLDSVGGIIECRVQGVPLGLGQPFFDSAESLIAHLLFAIPAVKGVEFGSGFAGARLRGSQNNDPLLDVEGTTATNNAGGINGGITNGNEIVVRAAVKPTPSIGREQNTYNLATDKVEPLTIRGRHDVCVALRRGHRTGQLDPALMSVPETSTPYAPQPQGAPEVTTRRGLLDRLTARLTGLYDAREARSIALVALAELAGLPLSALLTDPGAPMAADGFEAMAAQLAAGRPVQYVVGHTEFYGHRFAVREGVLIPRPETEELVSWVVHDERRARALLDVGTGSGCIAASLALALPGAEVFAADLSDAALAIAAENCCTLGARVTLRKADALGGLDEIFPGPFDAIVSNPPYVPQSDLAAMHANVREYEPREALFVPDDDALQFYRAIARAGRRMLRPGGKLYFEIYERSAGQMRLLLGEEGYTDTEVREDLNGKPRMVCSRMN